MFIVGLIVLMALTVGLVLYANKVSNRTVFGPPMLLVLLVSEMIACVCFYMIGVMRDVEKVYDVNHNFISVKKEVMTFKKAKELTIVPESKTENSFTDNGIFLDFKGKTLITNISSFNIHACKGVVNSLLQEYPRDKISIKLNGKEIEQLKKSKELVSECRKDDLVLETSFL